MKRAASDSSQCDEIDLDAVAGLDDQPFANIRETSVISVFKSGINHRGRRKAQKFPYILVLLLIGCGPAPNKGKGGEKKKSKDFTQLTQTVQSTNGSALAKGPVKDAKQVSLWYIEWKSSSVALSQAGVSAGSMKGVKGNLFDEDKPGSTFSADESYGNTLKQELTLKGNVHLHSTDPDAELTCDKVIYDAFKKVIRAQGHVRISGKVGTIGTLSEILATSDLKRIATPGMFYKK